MKNFIVYSVLLVSYAYSSGTESNLNLSPSEENLSQIDLEEERNPFFILNHLIKKNEINLAIRNEEKRFLVEQLQANIFDGKELSPYSVNLLSNLDELDLTNPNIEKTLLMVLDLVCDFTVKNNLLFDKTNTAFRLAHLYFESFFVKGSCWSQAVFENIFESLVQKHPDSFIKCFFIPYIAVFIEQKKYEELLPLLKSILTFYSQNKFIANVYKVMGINQLLDSQNGELFFKQSLNIDYNLIVYIYLGSNYFILERYQEGSTVFKILFNNFNEDLAKVGFTKELFDYCSNAYLLDELQRKELLNALKSNIISVKKELL